MYHYWAYGLLVESEIEFQELLPYTFDKPDVTITFGKVPEQLKGELIVAKANLLIGQNEYLLKLFDKVSYYATNGNSITVEVSEHIDNKTVRLFLLSNAFAAILYQRGNLLIHASGILLPNDEVVLFCGRSGAGKSTTVTALQQKGFKTFSDDVCVLSVDQNNVVSVLPSYPIIKLWSDSYDILSLPIHENLARIREELPKYQNPYHTHFSTSKRKINQILVLETLKTPTLFSVKQLNVIEAFSKLEENIYRPVQARAFFKRKNVFTFISSMLNGLPPVHVFERSNNGNSLNELINHLIEHFEVK